MSGHKPQDVSDWDPLYGQVRGMHVWRDMLCLPCMPPQLMQEMVDNFEFKKDDVLLVSYPQSSFFWAQEVIWHLHNLETIDDPLDEKPALAQRLPFLEHEFKDANPRTLLADYKRPRLLKTHLELAHWQRALSGVRNDVKVILWTAEPKDVVVNYCDYWNIKGEFFNFPKIEWQHFFQLFKRECLFEGDWYRTNLSWVQAYNNNSNFLLVSYEQSRRDPEACVRRIAQFLGIDVSDAEANKLAAVREFDQWPEWPRMMDNEQREYVDKLTKERVSGTILEEHYPAKYPVY